MISLPRNNKVHCVKEILLVEIELCSGCGTVTYFKCKRKMTMSNSCTPNYYGWTTHPASASRLLIFSAPIKNRLAETLHFSSGGSLIFPVRCVRFSSEIISFMIKPLFNQIKTLLRQYMSFTKGIWPRGWRVTRCGYTIQCKIQQQWTERTTQRCQHRAKTNIVDTKQDR